MDGYIHKHVNKTAFSWSHMHQNHHQDCHLPDAEDVVLCPSLNSCTNMDNS